MAMMNFLDNNQLVCDSKMNCMLKDDLMGDGANLDLIRDVVTQNLSHKNADDNFEASFAIKTDSLNDDLVRNVVKDLLLRDVTLNDPTSKHKKKHHHHHR